MAALLSDRNDLDEQLKVEIDEKDRRVRHLIEFGRNLRRSNTGGIQDASSRQAQAQREKLAQVILGSGKRPSRANLSKPLLSS